MAPLHYTAKYAIWQHCLTTPSLFFHPHRCSRNGESTRPTSSSSCSGRPSTGRQQQQPPPPPPPQSLPLSHPRCRRCQDSNSSGNRRLRTVRLYEYNLFMNFIIFMVRQCIKEQVVTFFQYCTAYSKTNMGRHQLYYNGQHVLFSCACS